MNDKQLIQRIEVTFPCHVELPENFMRELGTLVDTVCQKYNAEHPDRSMWLAGMGCKMLTNPFMVDDEHPMEWDESTYVIDVEVRDK